MNLRGRRLDWMPAGARHKFLAGKVSNPAAPLAGQYAGAYSSLLKGDGNDPFTALFQEQLGPTLAQAKESAGNLTGSGFANILGGAAGRSLSTFLLSILGQGSDFAKVGAQPTYTPGFLDYLFSAANSAAKGGAFAGGGGAAAAVASTAASNLTYA